MKGKGSQGEEKNKRTNTGGFRAAGVLWGAHRRGAYAPIASFYISSRFADLINWKMKGLMPFGKTIALTSLLGDYAPHFSLYGLDDAQETDTHWRCHNGHANFNWRCKFPVTLSSKPSLLQRLTIQLWDNDLGCAGRMLELLAS